MVHIFDIPREIRDLIYLQCVLSEGGYILDFNSNRLRCADGKRIDLAFMLTCKKIANETRGLALSSNILNFGAVCPSEQEHREVAGRFGIALTTLSQRRSYKLDQIYPDTLDIPNDIWRDISKIEPKLAPYVELLQRRPNGWRVMDGASHMMPTIIERPEIGWPGTCGETPSVFRKFARSALQLLLANKDRFEPEEFRQFERGMLPWHETELAGIVSVNPNAWEIPTLQSLSWYLRDMCPFTAAEISKKWGSPNDGFDQKLVKHHYSAAAAAIRFLCSLRRDSRLSIRKIILNEDRAAVAFPEAHGLGLIPYCQENPRLRVERRVSMWRTVFQTQVDGQAQHAKPYDFNDGAWADLISRPVAVWILEALELEPAGMPPGAFTLTFEGDQKCSEIFRTVVQRDAAWQAAVDLSLERQILPPLSWVARRRDGWAHHTARDSKWHVLEGFPQAVQDIVAGKSIVKCNFDMGEIWDVEKLVEDRKDWTMSDWDQRWKRGFHVRFDPDPPSPKYLQLLCDNTFDTNVPIDPRH
ncbi:hypothetical protein GCG54_00015039 [Colletotrichum gloeosporioides]|uniref:Uncharacterized protein n=1 Tax=Colletotrichum gloeosporioides TaxID=474922 RepID=A0A8H4CDL1_COLGL|nr:uncharacterized protein GCG54_00015039 [Colletotrichum gloeosporioides]KAF3801819.1 hypothetical protein GCG54_00015039 [Colletotrichum gloeosporioides]